MRSDYLHFVSEALRLLIPLLITVEGAFIRLFFLPFWRIHVSIYCEFQRITSQR